MSRPLDACPECGRKSLIAVCSVIVEYDVHSDSQTTQEWARGEVDDESSRPLRFRCGNMECRAEFPTFTLNSHGDLVALGPATGECALAPPAGAMTAAQFESWLIVTVGNWCQEQGLTPEGEGVDCGDLYRELESASACDVLGVTLIPAYDEQTLFLVGPNASWLAATGIELGIESETIWHDPLSNLRLDVPVDELKQHRDRLRRSADEITALLPTSDGGTSQG